MSATDLGKWKWVTLYLARGPGFPDGSDRHGYYLHLPLDADARIDGVVWRHDAERGIVIRFNPDEGTRLGWLEHRPGGVDGATWVIDYDETTSIDDEAGYRLDHHAFRTGEYVTVGGGEGAHTYRIAAVSDRAPLGLPPERTAGRLSSPPAPPGARRR